MQKILNPEIFQGSLSNKNYFEGWYFKHVSDDLNHVYAFIPGISLHNNDRHAFIQVINGINAKTVYIPYRLEDFSWAKDELSIRIGNSVFTRDFIELDIDYEGTKIQGRLEYTNISEYPKSLFSPGIMGWYSFVPFMECYHGVVSANHIISGSLEINKQAVSFENGKGYIEKDWGRSFPECWIWVQSNSFEKKDLSLFFSVAKIPWLGRFFIGFIAFIYHNGRYYKFTTYNKSVLQLVERKGKKLCINLRNKNYNLNLIVHVKEAGDLIAPVKGKMSRMIKESINSSLEFELTDNQNALVLEGYSERAGLEIIDGIFEYL